MNLLMGFLIAGCYSVAIHSSVVFADDAPHYRAPQFEVSTKDSDSAAEVTAHAAKNYHFNLDAPHFLKVQGTQLKTTRESSSTLYFEVPHSLVGDFTIHAFLCDDANTFCEKHDYVVKRAQKTTLNSSSETPSQSTETNAPAAQDEHGFWVNQPEKAFAIAQQKKLPLLIDFYGIWCPPCNELNEEVFGTRAFKKQAKNFVLLKLDADSQVSWKYKSQYKITGYPTLVFASPEGDEISRVIGFREPKAIDLNMKNAYSLRDIPFSKLKAKADQGDRQSSDRLGQIYLEREDFASAEKYLSGTTAFAEKLWSARIGGASGDNQAVLVKQALQKYPNSPAALDWLSTLSDNAKDKSQEAQKKDSLQKQVVLARALLQKSADHPEALEGYDLTREDLLELIAEADETLGSSDTKADYQAAASAYLAKMKATHLDDERGYALEYAFCLQKSGEEGGAKAVYDKLRVKYPKEFTFHYAEARMEFDHKHFEQARILSELAYHNSYGDNRLRAALLLAKVYQSEGKADPAKNVVSETLAAFKAPDDPTIRSSRYLKALQEFGDTLK